MKIIGYSSSLQQFDEVNFFLFRKQKIRDAMDEMQNNTCVRFRQATKSDHDRLRILKNEECRKPTIIGRQGGTQDVSFGASCIGRRIILQDLMHILGFISEHSRGSR